MLVRVDKGSSTPVSRQIADQIRARCLSGLVRPGSQLPSVRQLAQELAVNQNTILRVYDQLADEKLLELRHGEGTFVAAHPPVGRLGGYKHLFRDELAQLVWRGRLLGLSPDELRRQCEEAVSRADELVLTQERPARRTEGAEKSTRRNR